MTEGERLREAYRRLEEAQDTIDVLGANLDAALVHLRKHDHDPVAPYEDGGRWYCGESGCNAELDDAWWNYCPYCGRLIEWGDAS